MTRPASAPPRTEMKMNSSTEMLFTPRATEITLARTPMRNDMTMVRSRDASRFWRSMLPLLQGQLERADVHGRAQPAAQGTEDVPPHADGRRDEDHQTGKQLQGVGHETQGGPGRQVSEG